MKDLVFEGSWSDVSKKVSDLDNDAQVRLEVILPGKSGKMMKFGALKLTRELTDEDFRAAEWRPQDA